MLFEVLGEMQAPAVGKCDKFIVWHAVPKPKRKPLSKYAVTEANVRCVVVCPIGVAYKQKIRRTERGFARLLHRVLEGCMTIQFAHDNLSVASHFV